MICDDQRITPHFLINLICDDQRITSHFLINLIFTQRTTDNNY